VREELGRRGLLDAELDIQPAYDDAGHRVTYRMTVEEGAQYRMGALEIAGLSEDDAAKVRKEWKLTGGPVFDATYLGEFLNGPFRRALKSASAARTLTASVKPDPAKTIVDVSIEVK
jgi:outer membrane protein assembly factor BamA